MNIIIMYKYILSISRSLSLCLLVESSLEGLGMIGNQVNKAQFINLLEMFTDDMTPNNLKDFLELMQSSIKVLSLLIIINNILSPSLSPSLPPSVNTRARG